MKKYSILFPDGIPEKEERETLVGTVGSRTLYHLSLDRIMGLLCEDPKVNDAFVRVISEPLQTPRAIRYRQEILKEFLARTSFFYEFSGIYERFQGVWDSYEREKQSAMRTARNTTAGITLNIGMTLLQSSSMTLRRCITFVRQLSDLFQEEENGRVGHAGRPVSAEGLRLLRRAIDDISKQKAMDDLNHLCASFDSFGADTPLDYKARLGYSGQIESAALAEHKYIDIVDPDTQKKFLFFKRSADEKAAGSCVRVHEGDETVNEKIKVAPMMTLAETMDEICEWFFDQFAYIGRELAFYDAAVRYCNALTAKKVSLTYPAIPENGTIECQQLKDVYLLMTCEREETIIANDVGRGQDGIVVFGANGTGKTVYLRSIGTAQILAQAGLPIPAASASIPVCSQIVTQFSEAEKEFEKGNDAGRFEQEVRELANVVDSLRAGAFVLLNETFQTTSYEEGAEGLYHILRYFTDNHMQWLLVSHLRQLEDRLAADSVRVMHTQTGFHVADRT